MNEAADGSKDAGKRGREYDLEDRVIEFAVRIVDIVEALPTTRISRLTPATGH